MRSYWGRIDVDEQMPPASLMRQWEREARAQYDPHIEKRDFERFTSDYVWNKIADWQEESNGRTVSLQER